MTNVCLDFLIDTEGRTSASYMIHICTLHLNTCKRDCHQKQWEKIGLTAFNMNANHEHQHNTRKHTKKHYARSLGKKSMEEKIQNRKTARKPQKKKRTIP